MWSWKWHIPYFKWKHPVLRRWAYMLKKNYSCFSGTVLFLFIFFFSQIMHCQIKHVFVSLSFNLQDQNIVLQDGKVTAVKTTESKECELSGNSYSVHTVGLYLILKILSGITIIWDKNTRISVLLDPRWNVCISHSYM